MDTTNYFMRIKRDDRNVERMRHPKKKVIPGHKKAKANKNHRDGSRDKREAAYEDSE
jgi:hypothetical protein